MDSTVHFENEKFVGRTNIKSGLVNSVVALSVKEVPGVAGHKVYKGLRGKSNGIKILYGKDGVEIDVCIVLEYGYAAADVIYRVQENIVNAAGSMLDKKIRAVNVKVVDVAIPHLEASSK